MNRRKEQAWRQMHEEDEEEYETDYDYDCEYDYGSHFRPAPGPVFNNNGRIASQANTVGNHNFVDTSITGAFNEITHRDTKNYSGKFANFNEGKYNNSKNNLTGTFNMRD